LLEVTSLCDATEYLLGKQVVIFDLDDTLYSEKEYVKSGFEELAYHNSSLVNMAQKLWRAFQSGEKAIDFVLKSEGVYSDEKAAECVELYRNHSPRINMYPQAEKLLNKLKCSGVSLGLITDGRPEGQRAKILSLNLERFFEKIIITDDLGGIAFRKPNPISFELMQAHFGEPYSQMVYVGDNPNKDFVAPQKLGMDYVFFRNPDGLYSIM